MTLADVQTVALLAFEGCHTAAIASVTDLLRIANAHAAKNEAGPHFGWCTVSPDGRSVRTMGGLKLSVDGDLQDVPEPAIIFIPGIWYKDDAELLRRVDMLWLACRRWLESAYAQGACLAATCSGTFLLARTGLLDRRKATTSWWLERTFRETFPRVRLHADELVTQDHRLWCGGAYTAYLNLGLRLVEAVASPAVARACARIMLIDANRAFQTPYAVLQTHVGHADDLVWRAQTWMQARLMDGFRVQEVADALKVTERTLIRHFKRTLGETPGRYLQGLRIESARWLLETTQLGLEQIIEQVGYADVSSFRRVFERATRLSPREYRQRFALGLKSRLPRGTGKPADRPARGPQRRSA